MTQPMTQLSDEKSTDPVLEQAKRDAVVGETAPERTAEKPGQDSASDVHRNGPVRG